MTEQQLRDALLEDDEAEAKIDRYIDEQRRGSAEREYMTEKPE